MASDLFDAIGGGDLDRVKELLIANPSLVGERDEKGLSPLMLALYHRRADIAQVLFEVDETLDIFEAAAMGGRERLARLLDDDPNGVNVWSVDGFGPLHLAAFFGKPEAVGLLLDRGADPAAQARNPSGVFPLNSAAAGGSSEVVRLLLEAGAPADGAQHGGWTALHAAAQIGDQAMVRLLLDHGADPDKPSDDGDVARDKAAAAGHQPVVDMLTGARRQPS